MACVEEEEEKNKNKNKKTLTSLFLHQMVSSLISDTKTSLTPSCSPASPLLHLLKQNFQFF
jgi:hypothetical protein